MGLYQLGFMAAVLVAFIQPLVFGAKLNGFLKPKIKFNFKAIPALLGGAIMISLHPLDANALSSGSRSGGSSFRSSSTRTYSAPSRTSSYTSVGRGSYGYSPSIFPIVPMPIFYSPFGFQPINFNLVIFAFTAYALYSFLSNRMGGSKFDEFENNNELSTVLKLQLSINSDWNNDNNIMSNLALIANNYGNSRDRNTLAKLLSETSLCLLRKQNDWHSASIECNTKFDLNSAEQSFQRLAIAERSKFNVETAPDSYRGIIRGESQEFKPTLAVISVIVAMKGRTGVNLRAAISHEDIRLALQNLAADALVDDGSNIMAVEVLWTPNDPSTSLDEREFLEEYPEMLKL